MSRFRLKWLTYMRSLLTYIKKLILIKINKRLRVRLTFPSDCVVKHVTLMKCSHLIWQHPEAHELLGPGLGQGGEVELGLAHAALPHLAGHAQLQLVHLLLQTHAAAPDRSIINSALRKYSLMKIILKIS